MDFPVSEEKVVTICGAGLNGCLMAVLLAKRGYYVRIYESREDWRTTETLDSIGARLFNPDKRSINLSLVKRGIGALKRAGIFEESKKHLIPMPHRCIHPSEQEGKLLLQPYGVKKSEVLYSVSRQYMNAWLLNKATESGKVRIMFQAKINRVNPDGSVVVKEVGKEEYTVKSRFTLGTDGAHSAVRDSAVLFSLGECRKKYLDVGYKEIVIPPAADMKSYALPHADALHVWPRGDCFMIAMPNPDFSWTCTMIIPFAGEMGLNNITTVEKADAFFKKFFPDVHAATPNVAEQFIKNPTSPLISVWLDPYHFNDKILIMGDAAHAVTPFFGQGANSCFEDCEILDELLEKHGDDITTVFKEFSRIRVASAHALTDLCIAHGKELGKDTDSAYWLFKRKIGRTLHSIAPNQWIPFMTMVAFTRIPYDEAVKKKKQMENILDAGVGVAGLFSLLGLIYGAKAIGASL